MYASPSTSFLLIITRLVVFFPEVLPVPEFSFISLVSLIQVFVFATTRGFWQLPPQKNAFASSLIQKLEHLKIPF
jgi:hypothetical protein